MGEVDHVGVLIRGKYLLVVRGLGEPLLGANNNKEVKIVNKRADNKSSDSKAPVTVNIFSNIRVSVGGKSVLGIIIVGVLLVVLDVSGIEPETLLNLIRSFIEAFLGS
jgi:hypothetical protein